MSIKIKNWLIISGFSLILGSFFVFAREHRIGSHFLFSLNYLIEYFGYGLKAFLLFFFLIFLFLTIAYFLIRFFSKKGFKIKVALLLLIILSISAFFYLGPTNLLNSVIAPIEPKLNTNDTYVVITMDTEEDWDSSSGCFLPTYKYIDSGIFYQMIDNLFGKGISTTFYLTPNLVQDKPEIAKYLENKGQDIGVHLHPHDLISIAYPYCPPYSETKEDNIANYSFAEKLELMKRAKEDIEETAGKEIFLYRSGKLSCDYEIEKIAKILGYQAISNHRGTYYIEPIGIWNIDVADDILDSRRFNNLEKYINYFESRAKKENIIIFSGHPMRLYDHQKNQVNENQLRLFNEFVDYLKKNGVKMINQHQLLNLIKENYE